MRYWNHMPARIPHGSSYPVRSQNSSSSLGRMAVTGEAAERGWGGALPTSCAGSKYLHSQSCRVASAASSWCFGLCKVHLTDCRHWRISLNRFAFLRYSSSSWCKHREAKADCGFLFAYETWNEFFLKSLWHESEGDSLAEEDMKLRNKPRVQSGAILRLRRSCSVRNLQVQASTWLFSALVRSLEEATKDALDKQKTAPNKLFAESNSEAQSQPVPQIHLFTVQMLESLHRAGEAKQR